jgi:hypothetical protein
MPANLRRLGWIVGLLAVSGCSTMSNRTKTLLLMGGAGLAAGTAGAVLAPPGERPALHGVLWGGAAAAGAGAAGLFLFDEQARREAAELRAAKLEKELTGFGDDVPPELLATNRLGVEKPLPAKFRHLVTPGQWSLYKVDRWVSSTDSELVHQDMIFRFNQPQLNPSGKPLAGAGHETQPKEDKSNGTNQ